MENYLILSFIFTILNIFYYVDFSGTRPLEPQWFVGEEDIPKLLAENLEVANFDYPVAGVLAKNGWDGELAACVGLKLTNDNRRIKKGQLIMRGHLSKVPAIIQASKLWDTADKEVAVHIICPQAVEFDFSNGSMTSEFLTGEGIKVLYSKNNQAILPTELAAHGIQNFCLRLMVNVANLLTINDQKPGVKFTLLFFPHTQQEMQQWSAIINGPGWPGIKILEGEAQLFPPAAQGMWGCPIYPLFCTTIRFEAAPNMPSTAEMKYVIACIMQTARDPNATSSHRTLKRKWDKILANSEEYVERMPHTTWPPAPAPPANKSKNTNFFFIYHSIHSTHAYTLPTQGEAYFSIILKQKRSKLRKGKRRNVVREKLGEKTYIKRENRRENRVERN